MCVEITYIYSYKYFVLAQHDHVHDEHGVVGQYATLQSLHHLEQAVESKIGNTTVLSVMGIMN